MHLSFSSQYDTICFTLTPGDAPWRIKTSPEQLNTRTENMAYQTIFTASPQQLLSLPNVLYYLQSFKSSFKVFQNIYFITS